MLKLFFFIMNEIKKRRTGKEQWRIDSNDKPAEEPKTEIEYDG